ncbi:hypothetical protein BD779DRAFT_1487779 [Infundibulicybe gibba]|nr:hypothetical protein BD779DRAFT_1487779 [Infundibulicybe gibba]
MLSRCFLRPIPWLASSTPRIPSNSRNYAISVKPAKILPGKHLPRVFRDKKAFQYNWYTKILSASTSSPLIFLHHNDFSAQRLIKLRRDILTAFNRNTPSLASPGQWQLHPTLSDSNSNQHIGAALRDLPNINLEEVERMLDGTNGGFAVLSLPSFDPPQMNAILRALDRGVPPRKPKTPEELKRERVKRMRAILEPELKLVGALIDGRVFLPDSVRDVSKLPTLDTLRAQIVGLLSAPATQLAGVLSEASGGRLARTLEGLRKGRHSRAPRGRVTYIYPPTNMRVLSLTIEF